MSKPVFLAILAATCGACKNFKDSGNLETLRKSIESSGNVIFKAVNVPEIGAPIQDKTVPAFIGSYVKSYPQFMIISQDTWNGITKPPTGLFINGVKIEGGNYIRIDSRVPTVDSLLEWIQDCLSLLNNTPKQQAIVEKYPSQSEFKNSCYYKKVPKV